MAPKAMDASGPLQPERSLSRAWPAPTKTPPTPTVRGASTGDIQGALPLLVRQAAPPPRATGPRGGPWPRKRWRKETHRPQRSLSRAWPAPTKASAIPWLVAHPRGIYKGPSPCWYITRPRRRGPPARPLRMCVQCAVVAFGASGSIGASRSDTTAATALQMSFSDSVPRHPGIILPPRLRPKEIVAYSEVGDRSVRLRRRGARIPTPLVPWQ